MEISSQKGLTLIEVAIASVLLVVSLCGSLALFNYSQEAVTRTRNRTIAVRSAFTMLEQIRASQYANIPAFNGTNTPVADLAGGNCAVAVDNTIPALLGVTATVTWNEKGPIGSSETISLTTMIASRY